MLSLCIVVALTFSAIPNGAPEFLAPEFELEGVEETNTPGSAGWYLPVEKLKLPVTWRITRNGRAVTNSQGRTRISLTPTTGLWPNNSWHGLSVKDWYCGYDIGNVDYVRLPGESDPDPQYFNLASPEMFNLTWNTHVGSTNYHYSALACSDDEYSVSSLYSGTELFKPQASRFDSIARSALLGSYEAYYERLYYASQAQRNEWEVDDWGETDDLQQFNFNPTNDLIATTPRFHPSYPTNDFESAEDGPLRPIPASRRLTDADNIARLIENVRALFPAKLKVWPLEDPDDDPPQAVLDARPFVFRPHWLTDPRDYPRGDGYGANLWWASTVPPPASTQLVWGTRQRIESSALGLFPAIDEFTEVSVLWSVGVPFSCYAVTLDMLERGDGFSCSGYDSANPCRELFNAVITDCPRADDPRLWWDIYPFDFQELTVPGFLTNAYPRAAASVPNRSDAYSRYVDVGTETDVVRRMVPGRLDLVNQLMSVMDRTIMIPSMHVISTNTAYSFENTCDYSGDESIIEAEWNGSSWDVTGEEEYSLSGTPELSFDEDTEVIDGITLRISATSTTTNHNTVSYDGGGDLYLDADWMYNHLPKPSTNFVAFTSGKMCVWVASVDGPNLGAVGITGDEESGKLTFPFTPSVRLRRSYDYSGAEYVGDATAVVGPHQPGGYGAQAGGCQYALLDAKVTDTLDFQPMWRSALGEYSAGELPDILSDHADLCASELWGEADEARDLFTSPTYYIPLPSNAKLRFPGGDGFTAEGELTVRPRPDPPDAVITNTVYHFVLPAAGESVGATHYGMLETNVWIHVYAWEVHVDHVFDTNWVETVTSVTNLVDDYFAPGEYSEYYDGGTVVDWIDGPVPPEVEMVFTNSYPSEVEQVGTAVTNWTSTTYFDLYETVQNAYEIIESWRYEADHTRDWTDDPYYEIEEHDEHFPGGDLTTNFVTTVELTVTNSLPGDARDRWEDRIYEDVSVGIALVRDKSDERSIYLVRTSQLTGKSVWDKIGPPIPVGHYDYNLRVTMSGEVDADVEPDHDAWDESLFFRVMTQVDWLWNYMQLEKEEQ